MIFTEDPIPTLLKAFDAAGRPPPFCDGSFFCDLGWGHEELIFAAVDNLTGVVLAGLTVNQGDGIEKNKEGACTVGQDGVVFLRPNRIRKERTKADWPKDSAGSFAQCQLFHDGVDAWDVEQVRSPIFMCRSLPTPTPSTPTPTSTPRQR